MQLAGPRQADVHQQVGGHADVAHQDVGRPQEPLEALGEEVAGPAPAPARAPGHERARHGRGRRPAPGRAPAQAVEQVVERDAAVVAMADAQPGVVGQHAPLLLHPEGEGAGVDVVDVHAQLQHDVGALDHPAHRRVRGRARVDARHQRVGLVDRPLAHHRLDDRRPEPLGQRDRLAAAVAPQDPRAGPDHRAAGGRRALAHVGHAGLDPLRAGRPRRPGTPARAGGGALVDQVARQLQVEGPAVVDAAVQGAVEPLERGSQVVEHQRLADHLGERAPRGVDVVARRVVQAPAVALAQPRRPGDHHHGHALGVRPAHRRGAGQRAHPEGDRGGAEAALARVAVGGVDGRLLAGGVHHRHPAVRPGPEEAEDEVAGHAEHVSHPAPRERRSGARRGCAAVACRAPRRRVAQAFGSVPKLG